MTEKGRFTSHGGSMFNSRQNVAQIHGVDCTGERVGRDRGCKWESLLSPPPSHCPGHSLKSILKRAGAETWFFCNEREAEGG